MDLSDVTSIIDLFKNTTIGGLLVAFPVGVASIVVLYYGFRLALNIWHLITSGT